VIAEWSELGRKSGLAGSTIELTGAAKVVTGAGLGTITGAVGALATAAVTGVGGVMSLRSASPLAGAASPLPELAARAGSGRGV